MPDNDEREYFTVVFKGDIRAFRGDPLKTETPFGIPVAVSCGDILAERDDLYEQLHELPDITPWS